MKNFKQTFGASSYRLARLSAGLLLATVALAGKSQEAQAVLCTNSFNSNMNLFYNNAADTFAYPSMYAGSPNYQQCPAPLPNTDTGSCWMHRKTCVSGRFFSSFIQGGTNHYHMGYKDSTVGPPTGCFTSPGGLSGRKVNGSCVAVNPVAEQRQLSAMFATDWIEIAQKNFSGGYIPFDFKTINIAGTRNIQLWFQKTDGTVWGWNSLPPANTNINSGPVTAVWISGDNSSGPGYTISDFTADTL